MNIIRVKRDMGCDPGIILQHENSAILVFLDRFEKDSLSVVVTEPCIRYPIISFGNPPETCGVLEPIPQKLQKNLRDEFIFLIMKELEKHRVTKVYCYREGALHKIIQTFLQKRVLLFLTFANYLQRTVNILSQHR